MTMKRPREKEVLIHLGEKRTVDSIQIGADGRIHMMYQGVELPIASARMEVGYARPKGRKVLVRAPLSVPTLDLNLHLFSYHALFAVDTHTRSINGASVSASSVYWCTGRRTDTEFAFETGPSVVWEFHNLQCDPERFAWRMLCEVYSRCGHYPSEGTVGIVVDAHLKEIEAMNRRAIPVLDDWYLPERFTLIYASDAAADSVANKLVLLSHRKASRFLDLLATGEIEPSAWAAPEGAPYSHGEPRQPPPGP